MKRFNPLIGTSFLIVALAGLLADQAAAALILYEPFDYDANEGLAGMAGQAGVAGQMPPAGQPHGQVAPNGRSWMSGFYNANNPYAVANDAVTVATDLSYLNIVKQPGTGAVTYGGLGSIPRLAYDQVNNAPDGSAVDVYYSYMFRLDNLTGTPANGGMIAALNNSRGSSAGNISTSGAAVYAKASGAGFVLGILEQGNDASQATFDTNVLAFGETHFVVGKYTIRGTNNVGGATPTTDDSAQFWINPISLGGAEPLGAIVGINERTDMPTNAGDAGAVAQSFLLRQDGPTGTIAGSPGSIVFDELRVGRTYADVTPVIPEPATLTMVVLVSAMLNGLRRRR